MSRNKRSSGKPLLRLLLILLLAAAVALLGLYGLFRKKVADLQAGASFQFEYRAASVSAEPSAAYSTLEALHALSGSVSGQSAQGRIQLSLYASGQSQPFTDLYIDESGALLNVKQIYRSFVSELTQSSPLIASLIPDWALGDYISQSQLALLLGRQPAVAAMSTVSESAFSFHDMQRVTPENALGGYLYFSGGSAGTDDSTVTVGFPLRNLFSQPFECHILLDMPAQGLHVELTGSALAGEYNVERPTSLMQDGDVSALADIWQAIRSIIALVQGSGG